MNTQERFFGPHTAETEQGFRYEQQLQPGVEYVIDPTVPLNHDERYGDIIATISAGAKSAAEEGEANSFVLIDVRNNPQYMRGNRIHTKFGDEALNSDVKFVLVGEDYTEPGKPGLKGLRLGESFILGREHGAATSRFSLKDLTSRTHFKIECTKDGDVIIRDLESLNGTHVTSGSKLQSGRGAHKARAGEHHQAQKERVYEASDRPQPEFKLSHDMKLKLEGLNKQFDTEIQGGLIDNAMIIGVLREIDSLKKVGIDDGKIFKQIARRIHPDRFPEGTLEHERMAALFKVVNRIFQK